MSTASEQVVLVIAGRDDLFSDKVILALQQKDATVVRLDPSTVPLRMDCVLAIDGWRGTIQTGNGTPLAVEKVISVLWRWDGKLVGNPSIADPDQRAWAAQEDTDAVLGVLRSLRAYWMNHPDRLASVEGAKPVQLLDAAHAGLPTPPTLIATHGQTVSRWMRVPCVYKAFRSPYRPRNGDARWVLATPVRGTIPEELCAASTFQERVDGAPIRVTVIGERIFAVEVTGVDYDVDWRPQQIDADLHPIPVPDKVRHAIRALMAQWGLAYAALDFIATPDGEWVFLEVNPAGAYGFVEAATGLPITEAIADTLLRGGAKAL